MITNINRILREFEIIANNIIEIKETYGYLMLQLEKFRDISNYHLSLQTFMIESDKKYLLKISANKQKKRLFQIINLLFFLEGTRSAEKITKILNVKSDSEKIYFLMPYISGYKKEEITENQKRIVLDEFINLHLDLRSSNIQIPLLNSSTSQAMSTLDSVLTSQYIKKDKILREHFNQVRKYLEANKCTINWTFVQPVHGDFRLRNILWDLNDQYKLIIDPWMSHNGSISLEAHKLLIHLFGYMTREYMHGIEYLATRLKIPNDDIGVLPKAHILDLAHNLSAADAACNISEKKFKIIRPYLLKRKDKFDQAFKYINTGLK